MLSQKTPEAAPLSLSGAWGAHGAPMGPMGTPWDPWGPMVSHMADDDDDDEFPGASPMCHLDTTQNFVRSPLGYLPDPNPPWKIGVSGLGPVFHLFAL